MAPNAGIAPRAEGILMKRTTALPALGLGLLLTALACGPREPVTEAATDMDLNGAGVDAELAPAMDTLPEPGTTSDAGRPGRALAELTGAPGSGVSGSVSVMDGPGGARISVRVSGVESAGNHGLHLHETGDCSAPHFESAGEHFDPDAAPHACPPTTPRHRGDLGNLEIAANGEGELEQTTELLTAAEGPSSVVGRAIVLHSGPDDCATQPSGDSGDRLACGTFERVNE
jgi:Cu-Zn family superoxide dismutase